MTTLKDDLEKGTLKRDGNKASKIMKAGDLKKEKAKRRKLEKEAQAQVKERTKPVEEQQ